MIYTLICQQILNNDSCALYGIEQKSNYFETNSSVFILECENTLKYRDDYID